MVMNWTGKSTKNSPTEQIQDIFAQISLYPQQLTLSPPQTPMTKMLLHIITASAVKVDNEAIAKYLNEKFGTTVTAKAVKEHFARVKKMHEA